MSRSSLCIVAVLVLVLIIAGFFAFKSSLKSGFFGGPIEDVGELLQPEDSLPYTDLDGNVVDLGEFKGNVLVVNAWASWCPFCMQELPAMNTIGEEFKGKDVVVLAINRAESANTAKAFVEYVGSPTNIRFLLDANDVFYKTIGGFAMPETIFYRKDGSVAEHVRGPMNLEDMRKNVERALQPKEETE